MILATVTVLGAMLAMEAVSYLTHRFIMHQFGMSLHRSHHQPSTGGFERNDWYPLMFSSVAVGAFALGTALPSAAVLEVAGGITVYGAAYFFVHELYIHRRIAIVVPHYRLFELLKRCHRVHHVFGGEPYGMLIPYVPRRLRERAEAVDHDPFARRRARVAAVSG